VHERPSMYWCRVQQAQAHHPQGTLKHILQPGASPRDMAAAAADAEEDRCLAAGACLSAEQEHMLVGLREALYTNLGRYVCARKCLYVWITLSHTATASLQHLWHLVEHYSSKHRSVSQWNDLTTRMAHSPHNSSAGRRTLVIVCVHVQAAAEALNTGSGFAGVLIMNRHSDVGGCRQFQWRTSANANNSNHCTLMKTNAVFWSSEGHIHTSVHNGLSRL
jgi:hypothetical protein